MSRARAAGAAVEASLLIAVGVSANTAHLPGTHDKKQHIETIQGYFVPDVQALGSRIIRLYGMVPPAERVNDAQSGRFGLSINGGKNTLTITEIAATPASPTSANFVEVDLLQADTDILSLDMYTLPGGLVTAHCSDSNGTVTVRAERTISSSPDRKIADPTDPVHASVVDARIYTDIDRLVTEVEINQASTFIASGVSATQCSPAIS